jgi:hypothetical protein
MINGSGDVPGRGHHAERNVSPLVAHEVQLGSTKRSVVQERSSHDDVA